MTSYIQFPTEYKQAVIKALKNNYGFTQSEAEKSLKLVDMHEQMIRDIEPSDTANEIFSNAVNPFN